MAGLVLIVVGLMALAVGVQEVRTGRPAIRRLGSTQDTARRDGWIMTSIGAGMVLLGLSQVLGWPDWVDLVLLILAVVGVVVSLVAYRPREAAGRRVDPPSDPDEVWRRNPPGY